MGRASPTPSSLATSISTEATSIVGGDEGEDGPFLDNAPSHSLIQLSIPASSKDAYCWPILTFSASALRLVAPSTSGWTSYLWSSSTTGDEDTEQLLLSPEQVLASSERARRCTSRLGDEEDVPLQFVLIIDLAGTNINTAVSVLQIPVCSAFWSHVISRPLIFSTASWENSLPSSMGCAPSSLWSITHGSSMPCGLS